jgi:hypothetical protein
MKIKLKYLIGIFMLFWVTFVYGLDAGFNPGVEFYNPSGAIYNVTCELNYSSHWYQNNTCLIFDDNENYTFCNASGVTNICFDVATTTTTTTTSTTTSTTTTSTSTTTTSTTTTTTTLSTEGTLVWNLTPMFTENANDYNFSATQDYCIEIWTIRLCFNSTTVWTTT